MIGSLLHQRYRIDAEIGQGGMGTVYRAHDTLLDRDVAVKVLNSSGLGTEGRARLLREAQAVAQLNHPNIVTVYDAGETDGVPFIVMELATGKNLHDFGTLTIPQVISTARQLCDALHYAHQHGTIHRDIKPENILILRTDDRLTAKLMDFGMAHTLGAEHLTEEGVIVGTALYLAPELIQGQTATVRSDLYALGVTLYECAAGRPPFTGENMLAILSQHLHAPVVPPSTFNDKIPPDLDQLLIRLMSKQPEGRPGSAEEIRKTLEEIETRGVTRIPEVELPLLDRIVRGRLVARDHELEEANADWQRAIAGESRVLLISGEPGIGKTRFVRELMVQAQFQRATVLLGECYAEGGVPYAPIAQMIQGTDLSGLSNIHLAELIAIAPALQARFPDVFPNPPLEPQANQQRLYDSMVEWCLALNKKAPVLIVLDDAHWADGGTLTLLRHLARRALRLRLRLLMTLTYREVELDEARALNDILHDLNRERLATRLKLKRLDRDQTRDLLAVLFAEEITPELLDGIYRETEGNPFFIEEVCKALIEDGKIYRAGTRWGRPGMEEIDIPQSIKIAIQTRIAKLPDRVQDTLRLAAVLGREFDFDVFRMVSELDEEALIGALEQAERAQLIQEVRQQAPERATGSPRFAFTHALIHSNLHESLSGLRRQRLHRQVAATLAKMKPDAYEALAYHHFQAGDFELARAYSLKAGERALATYANQEAEKHFRLALELNGPDAEKAQALSGLGKALYQQDRFVEASERWHDVIPLYRLLGDLDQLARTYAWLSATERQRGNIVEAIRVGREGLAAVAGQPVTVGLATLLRETSNACTMHDHKTEEIAGFLYQALSISEELGDVPGQAETLARLGYGLAFPPKPDPTEGARLLEKAIRLAEGAGLHTTAEMACNYLAQVESEMQTDFQAAIGHFQRAIQHCQKIGSTSREIFSLSTLSGIYLQLGNLQEAGKLLERGRYLLGLIDNTGPPALVLRIAQAVLLHLQGEWATAAQRLRNILVETQQKGNMNYFGITAFFLALVLLDMQAYDEGEQLLEQVRPFLGTAPIPGDFYTPILFSLQQGNLDQARDFLARARVLSGPNIGLTAQSFFLLEEALVAAEERRWPKAFEGFKTAAQNFANAGLVWNLAQAQCVWAQAHLRRGKPKDIQAGRVLLGEALALYEKMGAIKHAEVVKEKLKALG
jgi:tetratricopeptide (TPR) repeat protein